MQQEKESPSSANDYFWLRILYYIIMDDYRKQWDEFTEDLLHKDRFTSSHNIIDFVKENSIVAEEQLKAGAKLYRARIYPNPPLSDVLAEYLKKFSGNEKGKKSQQLSPKDFDDLSNMFLYSTLLSSEEDDHFLKGFLLKYNKWIKKRYKGFNAKHSNMPPSELAHAGRANPEKISYLYLSEDPITCVYEVRPTIDQFVSVATFKTNKDLKIYDFLKNSTQTQEGNGGNNLLADYISKQFSKPYTGDDLHYLPTQYISEYIKHLGFDGIRYASSLRKEGSNIVLFSNEHCKPICSDVVSVSKIELSIDTPELYHFEEMRNKPVIKEIIQEISGKKEKNGG